MKKWIFSSIALISLIFFSCAWANQASNFKSAETVIQDWFAAMKANQVDKAASYLAPQFTSIHTDGVVRNKEQEVNLIKNLQMKSYHLTDFKFSQSGNVITVTYKDMGEEKIDNKFISPATAGRLAVLQKQKDKWLILAYANLDEIK